MVPSKFARAYTASELVPHGMQEKPTEEGRESATYGKDQRGGYRSVAADVDVWEHNSAVSLSPNDSVDP